MKKFIAVSLFLCICVASHAADKYRSGGGNWDTTTPGWGLAPGGPYDQLWVNGDNAIFEGTGGTLTLGTITAGTVTFSAFAGTYTLNGGSLTHSGGILVATNAGTVTISTPILGAGGLIKLDPGIMTLRTGSSTNNSYTGRTLVMDGILQLGTGYRDTQNSIPGGFGGSASGSHIELNGGNLKIWWPFSRTPGPDPQHISITGGDSGFSFMQYDRGGQINFTGSSSYELVWGSAYFKPDVLVLNEAAANPQQITRIDNKIDLIGTNRTVACNSTRGISSQSGNGYMATAGGRLLGVIQNSAATPAGLIKIGIGELQLTAANTYDGPTQVKNGALSIYAANNRIPIGSTLILGDSSTDDSATFKLHGYSQRLTNGLLTAGAGTDNRVINGRSGDAALTIDVAAGTNLFSGTLGGSTANDNNFALTKQGAGTLRLTSSNSYSARTVIEDGTLSVTEPYFSDTASVIMGAGATLNLDHSATDTVYSLEFSDISATAGTWGGIGSGASYETNALSGSGMIYVAGNVPWAYWDGPLTGGTGNLTSDGGSGAWSTSNDNWDRSLGARVAWVNSSNAVAIFDGSAGTVTLGEDITVSNVTINSDAYVIEGNSLTFASGGRLTMNSSLGGNWGDALTISSAINNSPSVSLNTGGNTESFFVPTSGSTELGAVSGGGLIVLGGSTTGNTIASAANNKIRVTGGEWTLLGNASAYQHFMDGGTLIVEGHLNSNNRDLKISDGATLVANGRVGNGNANGLVFSGNTEGTSTAPGGTLMGTGVVWQSDALVIRSEATIAPGYPTGTLTITNPTCQIDGKLAIAVDGAQHSALALSGALSISNATLEVNVASAPAADMIIATYDTLAGEFAATNGASGWEVDYSYMGGNAIALIPPALGTVITIK